MKRSLAFVMTVLLGIVLSGCTRTEPLALSFSASDVESVELFHYVVSADAEKKTVTQPRDISGLVDTFEGLAVTDKKVEPVTGTSTTSFRFRLSDGTVYEIVYTSIAVKSGRIRTTGSGQDLFTSADIEASWSNCNYEAVPAAESELPVLS